jgi:hypothetical protein
MTMSRPTAESATVSASGRSATHVRRAHHEGSEQREPGHEPRAVAAIHDARGSAQHGQHDDERFAGEQEQAGQPAGGDEVAADADREQREQHDDDHARADVGDVGRLHPSRPAADRAAPTATAAAPPLPASADTSDPLHASAPCESVSSRK